MKKEAISKGREAIRSIIGAQQIPNTPCKVLSVKGANCEVEVLASGITLKRVRLNASVSDNKGLIITPVIGSHVIVSSLSGMYYFVAQYSEIEKVEFVAENNISLDIKGKYSIKNSSQDLLSLLTELIDAISDISVPTSQGPSGTPLNVAQFEVVKRKFKQLLK